MSVVQSPTEETSLLQKAHNQSDTILTTEESSTWCDTAKHVAKLIGWLLLSIPVFTIPCWTKSHIVEHWNALFSSPDNGLPAAAYAEQHRPPELHSYRALEKREAPEDGFVEADSRRLPDSLVVPQEQHKATSAVDNILGRSYVEKGTVYAYMDFLQEKYGERAIFIRELVDPMPTPNIFESRIIPEVLRAVKEGKQFVFIPVAQESSKDHIVLFTLNLASGAIEYFDPKGKAPSSSKKIQALPEMSLAQFRSELSRVLLVRVNRCIGEQENPDLVELRDLLAQTDNEDLQTILQNRDGKFSEAYRKLTTKIVERNALRSIGYQEEWHHRPPPIGFVIQSLFGYQGSSIPELRKLVAACEKEDISEVRTALDFVKDSSFPKSIRDQIRNKYSSRAFSVESLRVDAQNELQRMEAFQRRLLSEVDAEILRRGAKNNPYRAGTYNYSYGSKTPHQGKTDWKNCGRFVMHFMKMRLEQSKKPKSEEVYHQTQESRDFQAAAAAVKKPSEIRRELATDLTSL